MRMWQKLMCLVVVVTLLLSIVCISSSADSYVYDDNGVGFTSAGQDFMGLPLQLTCNMGYGWYLNTDNYGSTLFDTGNNLIVSPSIDNYFNYGTSSDLDGVRSFLTENIYSSDKTIFYGTTSYLVSKNVLNYQTKTGLFLNNDDVILDELRILEPISSARNLSGGGIPVFSYDGVIDTTLLSGDGYFGMLPSTLQYDLLVNANYLPITNDSLDTSGALGNTMFEFKVSFDVLQVTDDYKFEEIHNERTWRATPTHNTDYVRLGFSSGISRYLALNYYNQGANVNSLTCTFNLRRIYHTISGNIPGRYIKNIKFYIQPTEYLNTGSSSPLWDNSFLDRFEFLDSPTPILSYKFFYSPVSTPHNYDDYDGDFYNWLIDEGEKVYNITEQKVSLENFNLVNWLGNTLNGVFNAPIIGPITLASILYVVAGLGIVFIVLKIFFGG